MNETLPAYLERRDGRLCPVCNGVNPNGDPEQGLHPCKGCGGTGTTGGRLVLVLHCTWGQDFDRCKQLFRLRYGEQVEAATSRPALNYGGAVHEALRIRYEIEKGKR